MKRNPHEPDPAAPKERLSHNNDARRADANSAKHGKSDNALRLTNRIKNGSPAARAGRGLRVT
jgi:hypothetical protein